MSKDDTIVDGKSGEEFPRDETEAIVDIDETAVEAETPDVLEELAVVETPTDGEDEAETEALDDLEAEELEMLTEDEAQETIVVDEAAEMRDIRRAQLAIEKSDVGEAQDDEFVCSVCFLVKKSSQLANKRKRICLDCAD